MQARYLLSLSLLTLAASAAWAYPEYRVTIVAPAGSYATDINNQGTVVGNYPYSATSTHAFLNRGSGLVDLGTVRGTASDAIAINNKGVVLGHWTTTGGERRGFTYYRGSVRDIGTIPRRDTYFTDINDDGYMTAYGGLIGSFAGPRGFLRAPDGSYRNIGTLPVDDPHTYAYALNNSNRVTGASGPLTFPDQPLRSIVWANGVMRDLGDFGSAPNTGTAINDVGQITGFASVPQAFFRDRVAFLYTHGRLLDIDGRTPVVERYSVGEGINIHGHVVGTSNHLSGFIYRGKRMQSLNALIDPAQRWDISTPQAINDSGQIAATAVRRGVQYAVRLDLIRPMPTRAPESATDNAQQPGAQTLAIDAAADAAAQAREIARPVQQ